jgi:hypothetical protein
MFTTSGSEVNGRMIDGANKKTSAPMLLIQITA